MCNFRYNELKLGNRPSTCQIGLYLQNYPISYRLPRFVDLPLDEQGMCIFHSLSLEWKLANQFFERFLDLLFCQNLDEQLEEIDFREFQIIGLAEIELTDDEMSKIRPAHRLNGYRSQFFRQFLCADLKIIKPWIFTDSIFHDDTNFIGISANKKLDFDGVTFKKTLNIKDCLFEAYILFKEKCRFGKIVYMEKVQFRQYVDFEGAHFADTVNIKHCEFGEFILADAMIGDAREKEDPGIWNIIQENTFNKKVDFSRSKFKYNTAITSCLFRNEVRFDDTFFEKGFNLVKPQIEDNVYFVSSNKNIKLFNSSINFLFDEKAFIGTGQILFKNVNLFQLNPAFKENLRYYELNHQIDIENCLRYRVSIERIYATKQIDNRIIADLCNAFSDFYQFKFGKNLNVEVLRNEQNNNVRVIYHSDDNLSIEQFEELILQCKNDFLELVLKTDPEAPAEEQDTVITFKGIIDRYITGVSRGVILPETLAQFFNFAAEQKQGLPDNLSKILLPQIINFYHYKLPNMNIQNLNIYGGNQQFATTIINNNPNLSDADAGILELINQNVPTEEGKVELIKSLETIRSESKSVEEKSEAKGLLKKFMQEGVGEAGKEVAKKLLADGSWEWLLQIFA